MSHLMIEYVGKIVLVKFMPGYIESAQSLISQMILIVRNIMSGWQE